MGNDGDYKQKDGVVTQLVGVSPCTLSEFMYKSDASDYIFEKSWSVGAFDKSFFFLCDHHLSVHLSQNMTSATPGIVVSVIPSSTSFSVSADSAQKSFSFILEAYATGTDNQPLTVYARDTLLQPSAVKDVLEKRRLVFTDVESPGSSPKKCKLSITGIEREVADSVSETESFVEVPAKQGDVVASYRVTYKCDKDVLKTLEAGKDYKVSLGDEMARVKWWKSGSLADVVDKGIRALVKLQEPRDEEVLKMQIATNPMCSRI